jgi:hypothetical protein
MPLSHASDSVVRETWLRCDVDVESCQQLYYQVLLAMEPLRLFDHDGM